MRIAIEAQRIFRREKHGMDYVGLMPGITEEEMPTRMSAYISRLAASLKLTREETEVKLKEKYDGYHFTWPSPDIYNPYSLLRSARR